ncbi:MAG: exosortase U [Isosphaeraceae bacterium]
MYAAGGSAGRGVAAAVLFLWPAIPPFFHYDEVLVERLQRTVSLPSSRMLDLVHVDHVMEGNVVEVAAAVLLVDQACSGTTRCSLLLMGVFFYGQTQTPRLRTLALLAAVIFWVVAGNVARVVSVVTLTTRYGIDASTGWRHELIGLVSFALMVAMVASSSRMFGVVSSVLRLTRFFLFGTRRSLARASWRKRVLQPFRGTSTGRRPPWQKKRRGKSRRAAPGGGAGQAGASPNPARNGLASPAVGLAFGLLLLPQFRLPGVDWGQVLSGRGLYERSFAALGESSLPERVGDFRRFGFRTARRESNSSWGEHSRAWAYVSGSCHAEVSLDYTFVGWHDLRDCYTGQGWRVTQSRVERHAAGPPLTKVDLLDIEGRYGHLIFGLFDPNGRAIEPPSNRSPSDYLAGRLAAWGINRAEATAPGAMAYQVQAFLVAWSPVKPSDDADATALFERGPRGHPEQDAFGGAGGGEPMTTEVTGDLVDEAPEEMPRPRSAVRLSDLLAGLPAMAMATLLTAALVLANLRLPPRSYYAWRSAQHAERNEYRELLICLKRQLTMDPERPELLFALAQTYDRLGMPDEGEAVARAVAPPDAEGYAPAREWLAVRTFNTRYGRPDRAKEAEGHLARLIRSHPELSSFTGRRSA